MTPTVKVWPLDCGSNGIVPGEVNTARLNRNQLFNVYCTNDLWTVIQSRGQFGNPEDFFYQEWEEYEKGFGVPGTDFSFSIFQTFSPKKEHYMLLLFILTLQLAMASRNKYFGLGGYSKAS